MKTLVHISATCSIVSFIIGFIVLLTQPHSDENVNNGFFMLFIMLGCSFGGLFIYSHHKHTLEQMQKNKVPKGWDTL